MTDDRPRAPRVRARPRRVPRRPEQPGPGIDLAARGREVENIVCVYFGELIRRNRWEKNDVLQEVHRAILARNIGRCPFNPERSSFGHYVYIVAQCAIRNLYEKTGRVRRNETSGRKVRGESRVAGFSESEIGNGGVWGPDMDASLSAVAPEHDTGEELADLQAYLRARGLYAEAQAAVVLAAGGGVKDVAEALRVSQTEAKTVVLALRVAARAWARG